MLRKIKLKLLWKRRNWQWEILDRRGTKTTTLLKSVMSNIAELLIHNSFFFAYFTVTQILCNCAVVQLYIRDDWLAGYCNSIIMGLYCIELLFDSQPYCGQSSVTKTMYKNVLTVLTAVQIKYIHLHWTSGDLSCLLLLLWINVLPLFELQC